MLNWIASGYGSQIASTFQSQYHMTSLRGLIMLNPLLYLTESQVEFYKELSTIITESKSAELIYIYYARKAFSSKYIKFIGIKNAINIYTSNSSISISGKQSMLLEGLLESKNQIPYLLTAKYPIIILHGLNNTLIPPSCIVDNFLSKKEISDTIYSSLHSQGCVYINWLKCGQEILYECKQTCLNLVEQLGSGYHEKQKKHFAPTNEQEIGEYRKSVKPLPTKPYTAGQDKPYEEHVLDSLLASIKAAKIRSNSPSKIVK